MLRTLKFQSLVNWIGHYTTFLGEAWANFGIIGIIIAPFIVGINIQIIQISFLSFKNTIGDIYLCINNAVFTNFTRI